jgi:hypothetical protein
MTDQDPYEMFPPHETFYIISLLSCTESALISADWVSESLHQFRENPKTPTLPMLNHLQNIALQGASISRFFWPSDRKYKKRGRFMRNAFCLSDTSPLKSRDLRNRMEHYDEYLDDYLGDSISGIIIPDYVGFEPRNEQTPYHLFRAYYLDTGTVEILGVKFELQPLVDEIARLHEILIECDKNGSRFPIKESEPEP